MRKKFLIVSALAVILGVGSATTFFNNENALLKINNQQLSMLKRLWQNTQHQTKKMLQILFA